MAKEKNKKEDLDFKYSEEKGYPNAPSEYDLKDLMPEDRKFLIHQLPDADSPDYSEYDNETKGKIIPIFRLRKSIESFNKKASFYSIVLIVLTIIMIIMVVVSILR